MPLVAAGMQRNKKKMEGGSTTKGRGSYGRGKREEEEGGERRGWTELKEGERAPAKCQRQQ